MAIKKRMMRCIFGDNVILFFVERSPKVVMMRRSKLYPKRVRIEMRDERCHENFDQNATNGKNVIGTKNKRTRKIQASVSSGVLMFTCNVVIE